MRRKAQEGLSDLALFPCFVTRLFWDFGDHGTETFFRIFRLVEQNARRRADLAGRRRR
jgi:hypothetical protein